MSMCTTTLTIDRTISMSFPNGISPTMPSQTNLDAISGYTLTECAITKEMLKPNEFKFTLRRIAITKTDKTKNFSVVNSLLGKDVTCKVVTKLDNAQTSEITFRGSIVSATMKGLNITCVAQTADSTLQGPPKSRCFTGMKLAAIVNTVCSEVAHSVNVHACFNGLELPYIVQHNESDYDFLIRLAKRFGAFLYCDNQQQLVFGRLTRPAQPKEITSPNVAGVTYELQTSDPNLRLVANNYETNKEMTSQPTGFPTNPEKLFKMAADHSEPLKGDYKFFIDDPNSLPKDSTKDFMGKYNKAIIGSYASTMATCKFTSFLFDIDLGSFVKINDNGVMVVTSETLTWDCNGSPSNEVTAFVLPTENTAQDDIFAPYVDINAYPKSSAQRAVVVNNIDPKKMGRVQVRFDWQPKDLSNDDKKKLPWIRIAQPYVGDKKGFYMLPEIGEEVMVGFEHENMEKPFVIGSLFHNAGPNDPTDPEEQNAPPPQPKMPDEAWVETDQNQTENEVKAFRTKKGHTIEFHDVKGDNKYGFIRIYGNEKKDGPNYEIVLSTDPIKTGQNNDQFHNITSASTKKDEQHHGSEDYEVQKLRIMVRSNGGDIMLDAGAGDIIMNAANIRLHTTADRTAYIEGNDIETVKQNQDIMVKQYNLQVDDRRVVSVKEEDTLNSNKLKFDIKQDVQLTAQSLSMDTQGKTEIKASDIVVEAKTSTATIKAKTSLELDGGPKADLTANNLTLEGKVNATMKGTDVSVEGTFNTTIKSENLTLDTTAGTRKGMWLDQ